MSIDFRYPHERIRMMKANDVERERAVRIYRSGPEEWEIQLRGPLGLGTFGLRDGKDFIVAGASCSIDDLRALRGALDNLIAEAERGSARCAP